MVHKKKKKKKSTPHLFFFESETGGYPKKTSSKKKNIKKTHVCVFFRTRIPTRYVRSLLFNLDMVAECGSFFLFSSPVIPLPGHQYFIIPQPRQRPMPSLIVLFLVRQFSLTGINKTRKGSRLTRADKENVGFRQGLLSIRRREVLHGRSPKHHRRLGRQPLELHQEGAVLLLEHDDLRLPRRGAEAAGENGFTLFDQVERWFSPGNYSPVVYS